MRDKIKYNEYHKKYQLDRYHSRRNTAIQKLGGVCVKCGTSDKLELDHINPKDKSFSISKLWSCSERKFNKEVDKCQLLCETCHREKTLVDNGQVSAKITHGTLSSYKYCRCELCKQAKRDYMKEYSKTHVRKRDR